jgi:hypothetical protein
VDTEINHAKIEASLETREAQKKVRDEYAYMTYSEKCRREKCINERVCPFCGEFLSTSTPQHVSRPFVDFFRQLVALFADGTTHKVLRKGDELRCDYCARLLMRYESYNGPPNIFLGDL